jgi:hypothetical protein
MAQSNDARRSLRAAITVSKQVLMLQGHGMVRIVLPFIALSILGAATLAQVMTPNIIPPGGVGQMNPNQGDMTANPPPTQGTVITCQGTGWNFTLACNSQYVYTVRGLF